MNSWVKNKAAFINISEVGIIEKELCLYTKEVVNDHTYLK